MIILGIDPGLQVCGYAVIKAELLRMTLLEAGVFRTDGKKRLEQRLNQLAEDVRQVLEKYHPGMAAVEELYSHYQHPRTAILMGHARWRCDVENEMRAIVKKHEFVLLKFIQDIPVDFL